MRPTLFFIRDHVAEIPVFGVGLLFFLWMLVGVAVILWLVRRQGINSDTLSYLPVFLIVALAIVFVLPTLVEVDSGLPVRSYGVMTMVAIISAVLLASRRASACGLSKDTIYAFAFWFCVAGFIGARVFHVIEYWRPVYRKETADGSLALVPTLLGMANIPQGGLVVYGSLIGGMVAFVCLVRRFKLPPLAFADLIAPSMLLGLAIGRLGCLLNGCCFGGLCELPWAVTFPQQSPPYNRQVEQGLGWGLLIDTGKQTKQIATQARPESTDAAPTIFWRNAGLAQQGLKPGEKIVGINGNRFSAGDLTGSVLPPVPRNAGTVSIETEGGRKFLLSPLPFPERSRPIHPTQLYSSLSAFLLCFLLLAYSPFRQRDGEVFGLMITIYPLIRILLEIIRTDEMGQFGTGLSISQLLSILMFVVAAIYWIIVFRQPRGTLRFFQSAANVPTPK
ncbi:MAG: prolipoprotein diacylglyceryl transferase [Pirellulales bacterium]|nr:prolipoprotein diacylglyceryl transferase [Pirellulales bacterium]